MKDSILLYKSLLKLKSLGCKVRTKFAYDSNKNIVEYTLGDDWDWNTSFIGYVSILTEKQVQDWLIETFKLENCVYDKTGILKSFTKYKENDIIDFDYISSDFRLNRIVEYFHILEQWNKLKNDTFDLFYPSSKEWMFDYCKCLGKFTDSQGRNYDLGIFIDSLPRILDATVHSDNEGDYTSGNVLHYKEGEREHIDEIKKRLIEKGFIL